MSRKGTISRVTKETDVFVELQIDGEGTAEIATAIPFLDHMLTLFAKHGFFDLTIRGTGDIDVDYHHLVEDVGICLGQAIREALGDRRGIPRYGSAFVPMDESLSHVSIDVSGRPYLVFNVDFGGKKIKDFDPILFRDFFKSLSDQSGITLHINVLYGKSPHHIAESFFKAFARAFNTATSIDDRIADVMSTKGSL